MSMSERIAPVTFNGRYSLLASQLLQTEKQTAAIYRERLFSISETRAMLGGVHGSTIRNYIKMGLLKAVRIGEHGHWKVPLSEILRVREAGEK